MIFKRLLKKEEKERGKPEKPPEPVRRPVARAGPMQIAILSGKGGCGKSTIAASLGYLLSALISKSESVLLIDFDVLNATLSSLLLQAKDLQDDRESSVLDYLVSEPHRIEAYTLQYPPNMRPSIERFGAPDTGVPVKNVYVIPAKKATVDYEHKLGQLIKLQSEKDGLAESVRLLYNNIVALSQQIRARYVIMDFPPLRADSRKIVDGVFTMLQYIPNFILVATPDPAVIHGLMALISQKYSFVKSRTLGLLINMVNPNLLATDDFKKLVSLIIKQYGQLKIFPIRQDYRWGATALSTVPIILGGIDKGAHLDFLRAVVGMSLIEPEVVSEKLGIPLEKLEKAY